MYRTVIAWLTLLAGWLATAAAETQQVVFEGEAAEHRWTLQDLNPDLPSHGSGYDYLVPQCIGPLLELPPKIGWHTNSAVLRRRAGVPSGPCAARTERRDSPALCRAPESLGTNRPENSSDRGEWAYIGWWPGRKNAGPGR